MRVGSEGNRGIPELAGFLAARNLREHRPEERHTIDMDRRRTDVLAHRVHPGVVAFAQGVVVSVAGSGLGQLRGQTGVRQRLGDDLVEFVVALVVNPVAHRGVQRVQDFRPMGLLGGDRHPYRSPCPRHAFAVLLGQVVTVFVEYCQAHDVEVHLDVADLCHLEDPARRDPAPRAQRIEPEIGDRLLGGLLEHGAVLSLESAAVSTPPSTTTAAPHLFPPTRLSWTPWPFQTSRGTKPSNAPP
ncbi:Uncharacterised protein [Mycobacterium tuberculosis]|uniref:Uncharacterized protein n=1 Tax=Mycobacterium tuberculosis TaxID=1773 RepID=A0A655CX71_MYCTX|nr:Uncharacterised protein [Mycobacterium tuberculosis]CKM89454.1 Uncharacterised protein [Mycobacterium tuberculosis]CNU33136.1 Uncharacterised protein [Mycobacterium tuberculosis]CNU36735.1 Uncharacterised protein [Mycobacterium tuberculosis]CNU70540.1 Uncharacterised protein [Mycobacterium tuberculosis]